MTTEKTDVVQNSFVTSVLPWFVGAGGLLVYLLTLNKWISLLSLGTVARTSGWLWLPELGRPLTLAIFFPFHWLPEAWIPLTLNIFTAFGAAVALVLLARTVALLPYDLTPDDPLRKYQPVTILSIPTAWMPPVLATIICGLELSFWENATSATGEIVNLLVFAYVIRSLLEFRVLRSQSWLSRCAFLYAAGMANSWVIAGYFPIFLGAIIWVKGFRRFWDWRFLLRMAFWGLAGLSFYFLLPMVQSLSSHGHLSFGMALKAYLKSQLAALIYLRMPEFRVLLLTLLLPFVLLAIRWKSHTVQFTDDSRVGVFLLKATGHFVHALFFGTSLWIALGPTFTPRNLKLGTPMLVYYYIWALISGYCTGYFLLLGSRRRRRKKQPPKLPVVTYVFYVLLCVLPLTLIWRNLGRIRMTNGPAVHEFARELYKDLPGGKSVVLSEDPTQLLLLRAELAGHGHDKNALLLDTRSLVLPEYHAFMANQYKSRWPVALPTNSVGAVGPRKLLELVSAFAAREPVVYLHPSSGLFFESFTDQPKGSIHYLVPRPARSVLTEALADGVVATNEQIWQQRWTNSPRTLAGQTQKKPGFATHWTSAVSDILQLSTAGNSTASFLGAVYSKSLNYWGVEMQQQGQWREAGVWFQRAIELNPGNLAAHINAEYNQRWQHGDKARFTAIQAQHQFPGLFDHYDNWVEVLNADGPVDEPTFLLRTGRAFLASGDNRQAAVAFARSTGLAPDWLPPKLWLAESYLALRDFTNALNLTDRTRAAGLPQNGRALAQWLFCRVGAFRGLGRTNDATACLEDFINQQGAHNEVLSMAADLYGRNAQFGRESDILDELLKRNPNDTELLTMKGLAELRLARYGNAIATLTTALSLDPSEPDARLLRAVGFLRMGQLDAARSDYQELLKRAQNSQMALFGLGGIAWREHDTNAIIQYYKEYLSNGVPASLRYRVASERLKKLTEDQVP